MQLSKTTICTYVCIQKFDNAWIAIVINMIGNMTENLSIKYLYVHMYMHVYNYIYVYVGMHLCIKAMYHRSGNFCSFFCRRRV